MSLPWQGLKERYGSSLRPGGGAVRVGGTTAAGREGGGGRGIGKWKLRAELTKHHAEHHKLEPDILYRAN